MKRYLVFIIFCASLRLVLTSQSDNDNIIVLNEKCVLPSESEQYEFLPTHREIRWFTNMPSLPWIIINAKSLPNDNCNKQLALYHQSLRNGTLWAIQMFDSSVKSIYGLIDGHTRHLGSFDQCYRINTGAHHEENAELTAIYGRYCLVDIKYKEKNEPLTNGRKLKLDFDPHESVWEAIREKGDYRRVKRYLIQLAVCIPAACNSKDIEFALVKPLKQFGNMNNLNITVSVKENNCYSFQEETGISFLGKLLCFSILFLIFMVILCTWYDVLLDSKTHESNCIKTELVLCFSARRNFQDIMSANYKHPGLDSIHALRLYYMICIVIGHSCLQYYYNSVINNREFELIFQHPVLMMAHNGSIITDVFLAISGLLISYSLLQKLDKQKKLYFFTNILIRYIRLTPVYLLITLVNALILPHISNGPNWKYLVTEVFGNYCTKNWWINIFYISNYVNSKEMCMFQSWYLATNFQCSVLALLIIYVFWLMPRKAGYIFLAFLIFLSGIPPFYMSYVHNVEPFLVLHPYMRLIMELTYFYDYYVKAHMRMTSYLVGLIIGVFIYDYNFARWRLPKRWSHILIILLGPILSIFIQIFGYKFMDPNAKKLPLEIAIYASIHRGVFAFSACSIIILLTIGDGLDFYYKLLNPKWMQPLSKLTYCVFIVHNVLQTYRIAGARTARTFTKNNVLFWESVSDLTWCFITSLIIAIVVEMPFRKFEKKILFKRECEVVFNKNKTTNDTKKID